MGKISLSLSVKADLAIFRNWRPRHDFWAPQSTRARTVIRGNSCGSASHKALACTLLILSPTISNAVLTAGGAFQLLETDRRTEACSIRATFCILESILIETTLTVARDDVPRYRRTDTPGCHDTMQKGKYRDYRH